jgi:hypothetical protein
MSEDQEYITLKEVAEQMGIKRASIYYYTNKLEIEPTQFENNKHAYITRQDFERVKALKEQPWKVSPQKPKRVKRNKSVA